MQGRLANVCMCVAGRVLGIPNVGGKDAPGT